MAKSQAMSIFLLKEGVSFDDALRDPNEMHGRTPLEPLGQAGSLTGSKLYLADYAAKDPWWKHYLSIDRKIELQSKGAILFLPAGGRNFAVTFGHVAHYLKDWKYEYDFGLLTTLNVVEPGALRSADILRPETAKRQRIQTARSEALTGFGIDFDETVIKRLTGEVKEKWREVFSQVTGANNVRITTKVDLMEMPQLCEELLQLYRAQDYKTAFPDLRNIAPVADPEIVGRLDERLLCALHSRADSMILSIPDIVDYQEVAGMRISNGVSYPLFIIDSVWDNYGDRLQTLTVDNLKSHHVSLLNEEGKTLGASHSLYKCLIWDCVDGVDAYHFCDGAWYHIEANYVARLKNELDPVFVRNDLPDNNGSVEGDYNRAVARIEPRYVCMDKANLVEHGNVEPCDLYRVVDGVGELIHVKLGVHSSKLSHLFNQGLVSLDLLKHRPECCELMKRDIQERDEGGNNFQEYCSPVDSASLKVVYAIITKKDQSLKSAALPLFSRVSLRNAIKKIRDMGVRVEVKLVRDMVR